MALQDQIQQALEAAIDKSNDARAASAKAALNMKLLPGRMQAAAQQGSIDDAKQRQQAQKVREQGETQQPQLIEPPQAPVINPQTPTGSLGMAAANAINETVTGGAGVQSAAAGGAGGAGGAIDPTAIGALFGGGGGGGGQAPAGPPPQGFQRFEQQFAPVPRFAGIGQLLTGDPNFGTLTRQRDVVDPTFVETQAQLLANEADAVAAGNASDPSALVRMVRTTSQLDPRVRGPVQQRSQQIRLQNAQQRRTAGTLAVQDLQKTYADLSPADLNEGAEAFASGNQNRIQTFLAKQETFESRRDRRAGASAARAERIDDLQMRQLNLQNQRIVSEQVGALEAQGIAPLAGLVLDKNTPDEAQITSMLNRAVDADGNIKPAERATLEAAQVALATRTGLRETFFVKDKFFGADETGRRSTRPIFDDLAIVGGRRPLDSEGRVLPPGQFDQADLERTQATQREAAGRLTELGIQVGHDVETGEFVLSTDPRRQVDPESSNRFILTKLVQAELVRDRIERERGVVVDDILDFDNKRRQALGLEVVEGKPFKAVRTPQAPLAQPVLGPNVGPRAEGKAASSAVVATGKSAVTNLGETLRSGIKELEGSEAAQREFFIGFFEGLTGRERAKPQELMKFIIEDAFGEKGRRERFERQMEQIQRTFGGGRAREER